MPITSLHQLESALHQAAKHLMAAAGKDERLTPREFRQKIGTLSGEMRDLTEVLYRFIVEIDKQGANHITEKDIETAVARVKVEIFPHYAVSENVMGALGQKAVKEIAPKNALTLATQLYQTARATQVLPAAQVFQMVQSYTQNLFFDHLGSEASMSLEAVHIPSNLTMLTKATFGEALGLNPDDPAQAIERYQDAASLLPVFVKQHLDFGLEEQAQALVDVMQENLRHIVVAVLGEDNGEVDPQHPVYVIGLGADGSLVGFKSFVIWT